MAKNYIGSPNNPLISYNSLKEYEKSIDARFDSLEGNVGDTNVVNLVQRVTNVETKANNNESSISSINTKVSGIDTRVSTNENEISTLKTQVSTIDKRSSDNATTINTLNSSLSEVERQADASATDLLQVHADIQTNKNNISTLQGQMGTANTNITNLQKELEGVAAWLESHV